MDAITLCDILSQQHIIIGKAYNTVAPRDSASLRQHALAGRCHADKVLGARCAKLLHLVPQLHRVAQHAARAERVLDALDDTPEGANAVA